MTKGTQEISYKKFDNEKEETVEQKSSVRRWLLGVLILSFVVLASTLVYLTLTSGYLLRHIPPKGRIVPVKEWKASDPELIGCSVPHPVPNVIVEHTKTDTCSTEEDCRNFMRDTQDIDSNFYIGGDGNMYEGTGWDLNVETMDIEMTNSSLTITFIGTYITVLPSEDQLYAGRQLLIMGVSMGKISADFQLMPSHDYESPHLDILEMLNVTQQDPTVFNV